jgi:hypothetical protein
MLIAREQTIRCRSAMSNKHRVDWIVEMRFSSETSTARCLVSTKFPVQNALNYWYYLSVVGAKSTSSTDDGIDMNSKRFPILLSIGSCLILATNALAETAKVEFPAASPACTLKQRVGLTDIEVDYSRPGVKGRKIFGGMIPYGKVWRTGANQATKVIFSTPVKLNGTEVPAGTYALMTIPGEDEWTIIINKGSEQWGAYKYDEKQDLVRIKASPITTERPIETFTIEFGDIRDESSTLRLVWDHTVVPVKLEVNYVDKLVSQIEDVMASNQAKKPYFQAAQFYYNHDLDLQKAKKWVDAAAAENEAFYILYLKAEILAKLGDKEGAIATAKHSSELAAKANDNGYVKLNEALISGLQ